jgi:hypothetical protein
MERPWAPGLLDDEAEQVISEVAAVAADAPKRD